MSVETLAVSPSYTEAELAALGIRPRRTSAVAAFLEAPPDHAGTLPWPFPDDLESFRYSVNVDPARIPRPTRAGEWGRHLVDLGGSDYLTIMAEKRTTHDRDPHRVKIRPGMELACWDLLLYYLRDLSVSYPGLMRLTEGVHGDPDAFRWENDLLGTDQRFVVGDWGSVPRGPLEFLSREVPDDLLLVTERDDRLYFDAGAVAFAAAWSVSFDVGMNMDEIHGPVPRLAGEGIVARAEQFLMRLPADRVYRRLNWNLAASPTRKFDIALESLPEWGSDLLVRVASRRRPREHPAPHRARALHPAAHDRHRHLQHPHLHGLPSPSCGPCPSGAPSWRPSWRSSPRTSRPTRASSTSATTRSRSCRPV